MRTPFVTSDFVFYFWCLVVRKVLILSTPRGSCWVASELAFVSVVSSATAELIGYREEAEPILDLLVSP